jgi:hypothetical protein
VRLAWAILTCLLLALGQGWPAWAVNVAPASDQPCRHCNCGGSGCCVSDAPAAPRPASPALPAPAGSHSEDLSFLTVLLALPVPAPTSTGNLSRSAWIFPPASSLPLHVRNCCFLI